MVVSMQMFRILGDSEGGWSSNFSSTQSVLGFQVLIPVSLKDRYHSKLLTLQSLGSYGFFRGVALENKRNPGVRVRAALCNLQ